MNDRTRRWPGASAAARGIGLLIALLLIAVPVLADRANSYSTRAQKEIDLMLSADAYAGIRVYLTTASLPTCASFRGKGAPFAWDAEAATVKVCNGTSWTAVGSSTITSGTTATSGCTAGGVLHSVSNLVVCSDTDLTFVTDTLTATKAIHPTSLVVGAAAAGAANAIEIGTTANTITFERSSDAFQMFVTSADATVGDQTWTIPNAAAAVSRTFASLEANQTLSGNLIFSTGTRHNTTVDLSWGTSFEAGWAYATASTPDTLYLGTPPASNSIHILENADRGADLNNGRGLTGAKTTPSLIIHSADQVTTEYLDLNTDNTGAAHVQSNLAEITVGGFKNNITEGSAQAIVRITMPSSGVFGATVTYLVSDGDGTDFVGRSGNIVIQGANKAGTSVCTILATRDQETEDGSQIVNAAAAFTLTYTWTNVVNTTSCDLSLNAASSAGANTYDITYTVILNGTSNAITVNPQ